MLPQAIIILTCAPRKTNCAPSQPLSTDANAFELLLFPSSRSSCAPHLAPSRFPRPQTRTCQPSPEHSAPLCWRPCKATHHGLATSSLLNAVVR